MINTLTEASLCSTSGLSSPQLPYFLSFILKNRALFMKNTLLSLKKHAYKISNPTGYANTYNTTL